MAPTPPSHRPRQREAAAGIRTQTLEEGRALFLKNCSSCHGLNAEGSSDGPSLVGVGAASVDFQVGTGRMPAAELGAQIEAKPSSSPTRRSRRWRRTSPRSAPARRSPPTTDVDYAGRRHRREGGEIYRTNCAMCHNFAGSGGALTRGKYAPSLKQTTAKHIYEAMLTGPQSMPVFGDTTMTPEDKRDIIALPQDHRGPRPSPGGARLGQGRAGQSEGRSAGWSASAR